MHTLVPSSPEAEHECSWRSSSGRSCFEVACVRYRIEDRLIIMRTLAKANITQDGVMIGGPHDHIFTLISSRFCLVGKDHRFARILLKVPM
jgi:hypothetical protein